MSVEGYLVLALAAVVVGVGGYVGSLIVRKRRLESRRDEIAKRSTESGGRPQT